MVVVPQQVDHDQVHPGDDPMSSKELGDSILCPATRQR